MARMTHAYKIRLARVCKQYGYASGCIVPGCKAKPRLHHFIPRREGGTNAIENRIAICHGHEVPLHKAGAYARKHLNPTAQMESNSPQLAQGNQP